jgi:hypothetical protein
MVSTAGFLFLWALAPLGLGAPPMVAQVLLTCHAAQGLF